MAGTLALVGGAEWTDGCVFDTGLLAASGSNRVLVVPTAAAYEDPHALVERAGAWFASLGAEIDVLSVFRRPDASLPAAVAAVEAASMIYVAGGSPMHLRSVLKDTAVWDAVVSRWLAGAVLAGSAEGATVMCSHMVDSRGGAFTVGLDLIESLTVIPRYNTWSDDKWHRTVKLASADLAVVGIDERTAIMWDGTGWTEAGNGRVVVYVDGRRVELSELAPPM